MASYWLWGDTIHQRVILDTNAVLMMFEYAIDVEGELTRLIGAYTIIIPRAVQQELQILSLKGLGRRKQAATAALKLINRYDILGTDDILGDDALLALAKETHAYVVTNDKVLRRRLQQNKITSIFLRGKQKLEIENW
ncbi:MAG: DNA-binding protein [Candidatus Thermoplasmatota archaeon]|nr:DNA-binding protein [Candidatus Thermoplasmatota archaeon]MBU1940749.1 DNA-binding protein [Candidatus Thermoplasmatota archaeon]